jgi:hypothetical protein
MWNRVFGPKCLAVALLALVAAAPAGAGPLEIGTQLGVAASFTEGDDATTFGIPGAGTFGGLATLYLTVFPDPAILVEPQIHMQIISGGGESFSILSGILQVGYLFSPRQRASPYIAAHGGAIRFSNGESDTAGAVGASLGLRQKVGPGGVMRFEIRYRRWMDEGFDLDELAFCLGLGGLFR